MAEPPLPPQAEQEEGASTPMANHHHTQPLLSKSTCVSDSEVYHLMKASRKTKSLGTPAPIKLQKDSYSLPSHDALAQILPDYHYLFSTTKTGLPRTDQQGQVVKPAAKAEATQSTKPGCPPSINQTYRVHHLHKRHPPPEFEDDPHMAEIADLQTKEIENYRTAMGKMAEDIIALRTQVVALESDNSQLRSDLSLHHDLARDLLKDTDIDVMTKAEMADRIGHLKCKLASETSKAAAHRDKIQQLQNELIRKNDREKELLRLQKAHQHHQGDLQHYQSRLAKMAGLEAIVKQQEKVIEKMEKVLDSKLKENKENAEKKQLVKRQTGEADNKREEIESALTAENALLRGELEKLRQQPAPVVIQQLTQTQDTPPDKDRLSLLSKLEKAEGKIQTLETQLEENSKRWGRQKQRILTSLSEYKHGFARTSTAILHDVPLRVVSDSLGDRSQHRQQKPVK